jgi:hypothetical protein
MENSKRPKPGYPKEGYVRLCCEIPREVNAVYAKYEELTGRKVIKARIMQDALKSSMSSLIKEMEEIENKNK